jgi:ATP-dependent DNA helicase RecG
VSRTCALSDGVGRLRYVSGKRQQAIERLGLRRVRDVLLHLPHRYLDFSNVTYIGYATVGEDVTIVGTVDKIVSKSPRPRLNIVEVYVMDNTGVLCATFFRQPWIAEQLHQGDTVTL